MQIYITFIHFYYNRYIIEKNTGKETLDPERLVEYNPKLKEVTPQTRIAYAKFKLPKIKQEFDQVDKGVRKDSVDEGKGKPRVSIGDDDVFKSSGVSWKKMFFPDFLIFY